MSIHTPTTAKVETACYGDLGEPIALANLSGTIHYEDCKKLYKMLYDFSKCRPNGAADAPAISTEEVFSTAKCSNKTWYGNPPGWEDGIWTGDLSLLLDMQFKLPVWLQSTIDYFDCSYDVRSKSREEYKSILRYAMMNIWAVLAREELGIVKTITMTIKGISSYHLGFDLLFTKDEFKITSRADPKPIGLGIGLGGNMKNTKRRQSKARAKPITIAGQLCAGQKYLQVFLSASSLGCSGDIERCTSNDGVAVEVSLDFDSKY